MLRSLLFLPGNNPNMLINAGVLGADGVIFDLEDAVSPDEKDAARVLVRNTIKYMDLSSCEVIVRINSVDTPYWKDDIYAILPQNLSMILLPKTNGKEDVLKVADFLQEAQKELGIKDCGVGIMPLVETVYENASKRIKTGVLNEIIQNAVNLKQPPSKNGQRLKIFYATQASTNPPNFVIFVNEKENMHFSYLRYLENTIRKSVDFQGTPIQITIKNRSEKDE